MHGVYSDEQRQLQKEFDTVGLADVIRDKVLRRAFLPIDRKFIETRDFFFLSTVNGEGWPSVSFKGGPKGFVRITGDASLAFPVYDGNGMFVSAGNMEETAKIGMLFIEFERPRRLRVHGRARLSRDPGLLAAWTEAKLVVEVAVESIFTNCPRYIPTFRRVADSDYVPREDQETPVPDWKRAGFLHEAMSEEEKAKARASGELTSYEDYREKFWSGLE